jgi:glycerol-3-phosphate acyltransferase PlsY
VITLLAVIVLSYLIGSFPTGYVFVKLIKGVDIRTTGSKSTGATNVSRILGTKIAVLVFIIDVLKGLIATILISRINFGDLSMASEWLKAIAGFTAVIGHIYPVWIKFKGGKGVGTGAGLLAGMLPLEVAFGLIFFAVVVSLTKYVSLGSILSAFFVFIAVLAQNIILCIPIHPANWLVSLVLVLTVLFTHRQNIKRLLKGEERKLGQKA